MEVPSPNELSTTILFNTCLTNGHFSALSELPLALKPADSLLFWAPLESHPATCYWTAPPIAKYWKFGWQRQTIKLFPEYLPCHISFLAQSYPKMTKMRRQISRLLATGHDCYKGLFRYQSFLSVLDMGRLQLGNPERCCISLFHSCFPILFYKCFPESIPPYVIRQEPQFKVLILGNSFEVWVKSGQTPIAWQCCSYYMWLEQVLSMGC